MAFQFSTAVRNNLLDDMEVSIGTSAVLKLFSGAKPATCATADSGTKLAEFALPSDWLAAASAGVKSKSGTWEDLAADAAGTLGYFRVYASDGTTCHIQGTVTLTGGGGDMTVDNTSVQVGQAIRVDNFSLTASGA